jgi:YVTN family beta-propeller protein
MRMPLSVPPPLTALLTAAVLSGAVLPALARAAPFAYVPNQKSGSISVIDIARDEVVRTLTAQHALGNRLQAIDIDTKGKTLYVVDAQNNSVLQHIEVGAAPCAVAVNYDRGEVYVSNSFADTVTRIDLEKLTVIGSAKVDRTPVGAAVSLSGDRVYISSRGSGTVSVVGADDAGEWARIPVGEGPGGCTVDPTTGRLLVANAGGASLTVVEDLLTGPPAEPEDEPAHGLVGRRLPPFELPDAATGRVRTSLEWAERKFILNFFASW